MPDPIEDEPTISLTHVEAWRIHDALLESAYIVEQSMALDEQVKAKENERVADMLMKRLHGS